MKSSTKQAINAVFQDRPYTVLIGFVLALCVILIIWCFTSVQQSDIQVVTRYTAFGNVHFYKSIWWHLYGFAVFAALVGTLHAAVMIRLHSMDRRGLGIIFGWMTCVIVMIAAFYMSEILNLAFI